MAESVFYNSRNLVGVGNVGIGTTNPAAALHVKGNAIVENVASGYYTTSVIPKSSGTINYVNITALNARTRTSNASATASVSKWTIRTSAADNNWTSVCWAPELSIFVAVAGTGTGNRVMTSPDGINWATRTSAADNQWNSVCWAPELSIFVAVALTGTGNRVMTSAIGMPNSNCVVKALQSQMVVLPSGNVGIGTANPTNTLTVQAPNNHATFADLSLAAPNAKKFSIMYQDPNGASPFYWSTFLGKSLSTDGTNFTFHSDGSNRFMSAIELGNSGINFYSNLQATTTDQTGISMAQLQASKTMTISASAGGAGNVGIGTANPQRPLHVSAGTSPCVIDCTISSGFTDVVLLVRAAQVQGTGYNLAIFQTSGGSDARCKIRGDGNLYNANAVYGAISDRNLKENIVPARSYMDDLNKLQVVKFSFKAEESPVPNQLGLIAQDVEEVFPGLVDTDTDGNKNLKYSILNMMMLKTVQELSAKLETAQNDIDLLESRLAAIEALIGTNTSADTGSAPTGTRAEALLSRV